MGAVSRAQISQNSSTILGFSRIQTQSVRIQTQSVLPEPPARGSKIYYFFGNFHSEFPKKVIVFVWKFLFSPVSVPLGKCSAVGHGRSRVRFPLGPSRPPAGYCPCLSSFCAFVSVLFLTRASARLPACCTRLLPHASLACPRCFGELLWDAAFANNFEEQLWGTPVGSHFAALQQH